MALDTKFLVSLIERIENKGAIARESKTISQSVTNATKSTGNATRKLVSTQKLANGVTVKTVQNQKLVGKAYENTSKSTTVLSKSTQNLGGSLGGLLSRAVLVIPIWLALRSVMTSTIGIFKKAIKSFVEFEVEMARVATVTRGTLKDLDNFREVILEFGKDSTRSLKEAATAMFALGSAGLTVEQQLEGMEAIMNLAIGTFGDTEQTAKLVAGAFNVFGKSMDDASTDLEKFNKISDIIALNFSKQQVELSEIDAAMRLVASASTLVDITFEELVTTISVLNSGMLKGSRAGTALFTTFIKMATSQDKLAELGVIFDPRKPLNFVELMTRLHQELGKSAKSAEGLARLNEIFGRRAIRNVTNLLDRFEEWDNALTDVRENFDGAAREIRENAESTLPQAFKKLGNTIDIELIQKIRDLEPLMFNFVEQLREAIDLQSKIKIPGATGGKGSPVPAVGAQALVAAFGFEKGVEIARVLLEQMGLITKETEETNKEIDKQVDKTDDIIKNKQKELDLVIQLDDIQQRAVDKINNAFKLEMMKAEGIRASLIAQEKLLLSVEAFNTTFKTSIEISDLLRGNFEEIDKLIITTNISEKKLNELRKQSLDILVAQTKEVERIGANLRSAFGGVFTDLFTGELPFEKFGETLASAFVVSLQEELADVATEAFFDFTKLDTLFGAGVAGIQTAIQTSSATGSAQYFTAITTASAQGAATYAAAIGGAGAVSGVTGAAAGAAGAGAAAGAAGAGAAAGAAGGGALFAGAAAAAPIIGLVALAVGAFFLLDAQSKKQQRGTKVETRSQTRQISSKIEITNKQLENVNRNLVALREEITFILPESAFFAENDDFSRSARRGS